MVERRGADHHEAQDEQHPRDRRPSTLQGPPRPTRIPPGQTTQTRGHGDDEARPAARDAPSTGPTPSIRSAADLRDQALEIELLVDPQRQHQPATASQNADGPARGPAAGAVEHRLAQSRDPAAPRAADEVGGHRDPSQDGRIADPGPVHAPRPSGCGPQAMESHPAALIDPLQLRRQSVRYQGTLTTTTRRRPLKSR